MMEKWKAVCDEAVEKFCYKQNVQFSGWLGGIVGTKAIIEVVFLIDIRYIMFDLTEDKPAGYIFDWYEDMCSLEPDNQVEYFIYKK
jgi:hypothetical protein